MKQCEICKGYTDDEQPCYKCLAKQLAAAQAALAAEKSRRCEGDDNATKRAESALLQSQAREAAMRELLNECSEGFYAEYSSNSTSNKIDDFLASNDVANALLAKMEKMQKALEEIKTTAIKGRKSDIYVLIKIEQVAEEALKGATMQNAHEQLLDTGDAKLDIARKALKRISLCKEMAGTPFERFSNEAEHAQKALAELDKP